MIEQIGGDFLQWLRGFYFVARRQSVTRASLEMRRNQSITLKKLRSAAETVEPTPIEERLRVRRNGRARISNSPCR